MSTFSGEVPPWRVSLPSAVKPGFTEPIKTKKNICLSPLVARPRPRKSLGKGREPNGTQGTGIRRPVARRGREGNPGRGRKLANDREEVQGGRPRLHRGKPARLPGSALHHSRARGGRQRRRPVRRDDPSDGQR